MDKPFYPATARNQQPILERLAPLLAGCRRVLEIGSGSGQHAIHFGRHLPHLVWQTSDLPPLHEGIRAWLEEAGLPNVLPPIALDAGQPGWDVGRFDAVFTANTCHIMAWEEVERMFEGIGRVLEPGGWLCIYGPFKYGGSFTTQSNAEFDASLRARAPHMGLRDMEAVDALARRQGLALQADHAMPANNQFLVWRRT